VTMRIRSDVSTTRTEYGTILLDERTSRYWQLTATAGEVLDAIAAGEGADGAVRRLTDRYSVAPETATKDVDALLDKLRTIGVVTP